MGNSHAIWDHTVLPATRQRCESRLYPKPKPVLDLATPEGCKADLTYVTWKRTGWDLNPQPVNCKSHTLPQYRPTIYKCPKWFGKRLRRRLVDVNGFISSRPSSNTWCLEPQTASWSLQPFLHSTSVSTTHRHTDTQTDTHTAIGGGM